MTTEEELLDELDAAGAQLARADAARAEAMARVRAAVRAAHPEVSKKTMADRVGVTRVTVYRMLED